MESTVLPGAEADANPSSTSPRVRDGASRAVRRGAVLAFVLGCLVAGYACWVEPTRPGVVTAKGYFGFFDQSAYLSMAKTFAAGHLPASPAQYRYGFGYPLLAAPLLALGFSDPFIPLDIVLFGVTLALTFVLGANIAAGRSAGVKLGVGAASAGVLALASPALSLASVPWNTSVVVPLGLLVLVIVTSAEGIGRSRALAVGLALGWVFATRYLDAVFLGLPVLAAMVVRQRGEAVRLALFGGLSAGALVFLVLASQKYALGGWFHTPYQFHTRLSTGTNDQSLGQYRLSWVPQHFTGTFITGREVDHTRVAREPIFLQFPPLALMPVGAAFLARAAQVKRGIWVTALVGSALSSVFYLSFIAGGAHDLLFGNPRYWSPDYPLWSVLAVVGVAGVGELLTRDSARLPRLRSTPRQS